jgi:hypothetical protein
MVDRQLEFEGRFRVIEINKRETIELISIGDLEAERFLVKRNRARFVEHADHHMDRFRHL